MHLTTSLASNRAGMARRGGFTLVELLVVIGIIALLIGILMPALRKARIAAKGTACLANLHSIGQAGLLYATNNRGDFALLGSKTTSSGNGWWFGAQNTAYDKDRALWGKYGLTSGVLICPAMADTTVYDNSTANKDVTTSYGHNAGFNVTPAGAFRANYYGIRMNKVRKSTDTVMMADFSDFYAGPTWHFNTTVGILDPLYISSTNSLFTPTSAPYKPTLPNFHGRHGGKGGVLWFDGHCTLETAIVPPSHTSFTDGFGTATLDTPEKCKMANIGFLAPSPEDLQAPTSARAAYYFLFNKDVINTATSTTDLYKQGYSTR